MITVKEAIENLQAFESWYQKTRPKICGQVSNKKSIWGNMSAVEVVELLNHLSSENDHLKSTMSEIRKHTTGTRALEVALERNRELEDEATEVEIRYEQLTKFLELDNERLEAKQCDCQQKARELLILIEEDCGACKCGNATYEEVVQAIKQKFNLGE